MREREREEEGESRAGWSFLSGQFTTDAFIVVYWLDESLMKTVGLIYVDPVRWKLKGGKLGKFAKLEINKSLKGYHNSVTWREHAFN